MQGLDAAAIGRLICPIGIPGIGGKLPAEIAIAVAAQILQLRRQNQAAANAAAAHASRGRTHATRRRMRRIARLHATVPRRVQPAKVQA